MLKTSCHIHGHLRGHTPGLPQSGNKFGRIHPALAVLIALSLIFLSACGKEGPPKPRVNTRSFELVNTHADPVGNCLEVQGELSSNAGNLERFRLELSRVNGPEDCPGCPFKADLVEYFTPAEAHLDVVGGHFSISYCPAPASAGGQTAPAYRWRLFALNVFDKLRHTSTVARMVVMP